MTSNDETKEFKEENQSFVLKKVGKYWILKTNTSSRRLAFLDDAKYVKIDDNILIADERLFEIHKNEKGEYLFRHLEDIACETYFSVTESSTKRFMRRIDTPEAPINTNNDNNEMNLYDYAQNEQVQIQYEEQSARPVNDDYYEEVNLDEGETEQFKLVNDSLPRDDKKMQHFDKQLNSSAYTKSCIDSLNIRSVGELKIESDGDLNTGFATEMTEGHDRYDPLEVGSTEEESDINVVDMAQNPSGGNQHDEFQVIIEPSQLTKMCAMEGEMTLSIKEKALYFKDKNTGITKYSFPFPWIRCFKKDDSVFSFQVGRKCPNGAGDIICITQEANQIYKKCIKVMKDKKASMK
ncbi:uncharacterized protein LOC132753968 [Ruditapes philippinarum]|uniref:uncharacterized protein LOC132753968 n=1 Tax=Ruditapes philippinarum TaxID=129788 RepID=UPI00295BBB68|nr:uncharacterized protein LOC132753968 [Ruditapes philippinarum]